MEHRQGILRRAYVVSMAVMSVLCLACGNDTTTTTPTAVGTLVTDTFSGSVGQNGSDIHTFTVTTAGNTLLAGFTSLSPSSVTALGLGIGSWDPASATCSLNVSQNDTARSGSTGVSGTPGSGTYCLRVYDGGNIPPGLVASYTVQVQHY